MNRWYLFVFVCIQEWEMSEDVEILVEELLKEREVLEHSKETLYKKA